VAEIRVLVEQYGVNLVYLCDPNPLLDPEKMREFCHRLREEVQVSWFCSPDPLDFSQNEALAAEMVEAGCFKVCFGVETMHDPSCRRIRPWLSTEIITKAVKLANEVGMVVRGYYMLGIPGQTEEQYWEGVTRLVEIEVDDLRLGYFVEFPGSSGYERYRKQGLLLSEDPARFATREPIIWLSEFPPARQLETYDKTIHIFHGPQWRARVAAKLKQCPQYEASFKAYLEDVRRGYPDI
jgi:radical SAM superfamily enzyme YgiQ (UPF0313 family)